MKSEYFQLLRRVKTYWLYFWRDTLSFPIHDNAVSQTSWSSIYWPSEDLQLSTLQLHNRNTDDWKPEPVPEWRAAHLSCPAVSQSWRWTLKVFPVVVPLVAVYIWGERNNTSLVFIPQIQRTCTYLPWRLLITWKAEWRNIRFRNLHLLIL